MMIDTSRIRRCNDRQLPIRYNGWATQYTMEVTVMNKYVSLDKRSKKAQREYHAKQRIGKEFRSGFDADLFLQNYIFFA